MGANNISNLPTKQDRQVAKLNLASTNRFNQGNPRYIYDIDLLPTKYIGNDVFFTPHPDGLVLGRPWVAGS